jgi:type IV secretion system protein VirB3
MQDGAGKPQLDESTLFVACTRPAMIAGVPLEAMALNVVLTSLLQAVLGGIQYGLLGVVVHVIFRAIARHDYNAFSVLFAWANTTGKCLNAASWGGFTITPLPLIRHYDERDFGDA